MKIQLFSEEEKLLRAIFGEPDRAKLTQDEPDPGVNTSKEALFNVLGTLSERQKKVMVLRFGLIDGHPKTLEEIGRRFNITRERIRQIEAKALRKMRHPARAKQLTKLIGDNQD